MYLLYSEEHRDRLLQVVGEHCEKYRALGKVLLLDCSEEQVLEIMSSLSDDMLKDIRISSVEPSELKSPEGLLTAGFRSVSLSDLAERRIFRELSKILGGGEIFFHAIVDVKNKSIFGFEALCRSHIPVWKLLKLSDRVAFLTDHYCREKALLEFKARFHGDYHLFINFHPKFLRDPLENVGELEASLELKGINPKQIVVEVNEYEGMDLRAIKMIRSFLKSSGIKTALDDVGAGYAGLYQIVEIHPDIAKLDMELVRDVHESKLKQAVLRGIVQACRDAGITVLAEGVEKPQELEVIMSLDVDLVQGFIFARPSPYPNIREIEKLSYNLV